MFILHNYLLLLSLIIIVRKDYEIMDLICEYMRKQPTYCNYGESYKLISNQVSYLGFKHESRSRDT